MAKPMPISAAPAAIANIVYLADDCGRRDETRKSYEVDIHRVEHNLNGQENQNRVPAS
jgi:hypothetical protein